MRFFVNGRLRPKVTPELFDADIKRQGMVDWDKFNQGILRYPHDKLGDRPGVLGFIEAGDEEEARAILSQSPRSLLVAFDIEPVTPIALFE